MKENEETILDALTRAAEKHLGSGVTVDSLKRLTGGSSSESWVFNMGMNDEESRVVLRRAPGGKERAPIDKRTEATLQQLAIEKDVPVPHIRFILDAEDDLGPGYVMEFIPGETIPRKILRDGEYDSVRPQLARQCGEIMARIHSVDVDKLPALENLPPKELIERLMTVPKMFGEVIPVFETASSWLMDHLPEKAPACLIHGDFRNGNLIVDSKGVRAILDWELAHLGDPMEDLGYISINSWRFGNIHMPVGGFGEREDLFAGYEKASGRSVDRDAVHFWEVFSTLKWGIICIVQGHAHLSGGVRSINRAATGRRVSETEVDLMDLLI
jgi:aminoglycoside phosphotransferase (APT) family kinase protein